MSTKIGFRLTALAAALFMGSVLPMTALAAESLPVYEIEGKDAGQIIEEFVAECTTRPELVSVAYENTVTGETAFFNEGFFGFEASLYKIPLNMYWSEKIFKGELTWDEPVGNYTIEYAQRRSLVDSNNQYSEALVEKIGSFNDFRRAAARFYGMTEEETEARKYLAERTNNVQRILHCLEMLYAEPERYPGVLDRMLEAQPDDYFRTYEPRFPIAQKYGAVADWDCNYPVNTAGILYTDEPFLLVVLSEQHTLTSERIGVLAQRLCDYTQHGAEERSAQEIRESAEEKREVPPAPDDTDPPERIAGAAADPPPEETTAERTFIPTAAAVIVLAAVFAVLCRRKHGKEKEK